MKKIEVLNRLVQVGPDIINQHVRPGPHCVLATSLGQMTLARFGIKAEPYAAEVSICNQEWIDWVEEKCGGGREEQLRRGAYILSNAPDFKGQSFTTRKVDKPWDGHLVLRVPNGRTWWLLDLDLGSFNRPEQRVHLPGGMIAPFDGESISGTFVDENEVRTSISYRKLVAPYADDYQTARDWVERDRFIAHVDELEEAIRA